MIQGMEKVVLACRAISASAELFVTA